MRGGSVGTAAGMAVQCKTAESVLATRWTTEDADLNGGGQMMSCSGRAEGKANKSSSKHGVSSQLHDTNVRKMGSDVQSRLQEFLFSAYESSAFLPGG
jgi:hypothetical protein